MHTLASSASSDMWSSWSPEAFALLAVILIVLAVAYAMIRR